MGNAPTPLALAASDLGMASVAYRVAVENCPQWGHHLDHAPVYDALYRLNKASARFDSLRLARDEATRATRNEAVN